MALEVNSQNLFQNAQVQQFVDFAEAAAKAGKTTSPKACRPP